MGNFERQIWTIFIFLALFLHCCYHWEHGTSQTASAESSGALRSHFQTYSTVTAAISARERRHVLLTVSFQEQAGSSDTTTYLSPFSSPLPQMQESSSVARKK